MHKQIWLWFILKQQLPSIANLLFYKQQDKMVLERYFVDFQFTTSVSLMSSISSLHIGFRQIDFIICSEILESEE